MNDTMMIDSTSKVVWTKGQPMPNVWLATDTTNPAILLAWSYKSWGTRIVKAYLAPQA